MRQLKGAILAASLVILTSRSVLATGGSVSPSLTAAPPTISCTGTTTVTLTIDGVSPPPGQVPVDVMLVLDRSGSMGGTPINSMKNAANSFVNTMDTSDGALDNNITTSRVGLVSFASTATLGAALTNNAATVHTAINALVAGGTTDIADGVTLGAAQLSGGTAKDVLILMTDGVANDGTNPVAAANAAKAAGIEVFTIGLGNGINVAQLQAMATDLSHYYQAPTPAQLEGIFNQIATGIAGPAATSLSFYADPSADFVVTGVSATMGTPNPSPGLFSWTLDELRTESVTITYTLQHTGATNGTKTVHQSAVLTYTDSDGSVHSVPYNGLSVDVEGCNNPPTADAGPDQTVPQDLSGLASVTLDGSGSSDDGAVAPLTYEWFDGATSLGTGVTLMHSFPLGMYVVTLKVYDGQYEDTDDVTITVTDPYAPTTTASLAGTMGMNSWYTSDVTVTLAAVDNTGGSGVQDTLFSVDAGAQTTYSGPFAVTGDGVHTVDYYSRDTAGNVESTQSVSFMIDSTPPAVTVTSPMSQAYSDDTMLPVSWTASDATSGIDTESATLDGVPVANGDTLDLSTLALGPHTVVVTATDMAGHSTSVTVEFEVMVTYDGLEALKHRFFEMGLIKNQGIVTSLDQKLRAAKAAHERGQYGTEDNILQAFISEVEAQAGSGVLEPAVSKMIEDAQWLMDHN